jgi:ribonuclease HII
MLKYKHFENDSMLEVGIDEAGRGCLAGPVFAAAVILPDKFPDDIYLKIKDSKKVSEKNREILFEYIIKHSKDYAIACIRADEIDKINILQASFQAMHNALDILTHAPDYILADGHIFKPYMSKKSGEFIEHTCIKGGDNVYISIAAASILAKVSRDRYIRTLCAKYPELNEKYGWLQNKAYGTKQHLQGIRQHGITQYHRKTFGICKEY